ncbi:glycosyltransferase [Leptolyngbya sp. CCNP1308]|uniref:glycosyltransferase n=1 Tax=Leptolyngbya sp. CCNP1308 TaxID=3110255 RepID=UPI002B21A8B6|nr:glycosyltransferase [Leptolyngbya sp. CCNP1308]MEA5448425.1 glycosyltransferase [Leptolyngbya sp. CCNP1308]
MSKQALVFFPHNPYPSRSGAHRRCLSVLRALQSIGYEITLLSSEQFTDNPWTRESIKYLEDRLRITVKVHKPTELDIDYTRLAGRGMNSAVKFSMFIPPGLRQYFRDTFNQICPDLVFVSYSLWGGLAIGDEFKLTLRILDTIDLYSQNIKMCHALNQYISSTPIDAKQISPEFTNEQFFSEIDISASPEEYWICDQYDYTIAISPSEAQEISERSKNTVVEYIPITVDIPSIRNSYTGSPLLAVGPNPFNLQGYCYFVQKVLPGIIEKFPEFTLKVVGPSCENLTAVHGTQLLGFVPDLTPLYAISSFAICPLIGGTGQQVKIVEAMAHGIPVIALENLARSSPIQSNYNGFIAKNAEEFSECVTQLLCNQSLCKDLGENARETIRKYFSEERLTEQLNLIFNKSRENFRQKLDKRNPKIVIDGAFFQISQIADVSRAWRCILSEWSKTDFKHHIVVLNRDETAPKLPGIRYRSIHPHASIFHHDSIALNSHDQGGLDAKILQSICDEECASVFISTYYTTPISTPSIFVGYDMIPEILNMDLNAPAWREKQLSILHASHYIVISNHMAYELKKFFPYVKRSQITVSHCGVESFFSPADSDQIEKFITNFSIRKPYIILTGERLSRNGYRNSILLFEALNQSELKQKFSVLCIDGQPELEKELQELAIDLETHMVHLTDTELRTAYSGAFSLVYLSPHEGFGLQLLEAMACGCPVIACHNSYISEVAGNAALYVSPDNPDGLVVALKTIQNLDSRKGLRERGLARAQTFSWKSMADRIAETIVGVSKNQRTLRRQDLIWLEFRKLQQQQRRVVESFQHTQEQLQHTQEQLQRTQEQLQHIQEQLQQTQSKFQEAQVTIMTIQSSKLWKIREFWVRIKEVMRRVVTTLKDI